MEYAQLDPFIMQSGDGSHLVPSPTLRLCGKAWPTLMKIRRHGCLATCTTAFRTRSRPAIQRVELAIPVGGNASSVDTDSLDRALNILRSALRDVQELAGELRARVGDLSIGDALLEYVESNEDGHLPLLVEETGVPTPLQGWAEDEIFTIAMEAIRNANAHAAGATQVQACIHWNAADLTVEISDDGSGFDPQAVRADSIGLAAISERARSIGASFSLDSRIDRGTFLRFVMPFTGAVLASHEMYFIKEDENVASDTGGGG